MIVAGRIKFVFHHYTGFSQREFYKSQIVYLGIFILDIIATSFLVGFMPDSSIGFIGKAAISALTPNIIHLALFYKTKNFQLLMGYALGLFKKAKV